MSIYHISWVLRFSDAEHGARLVMIALADHANEAHHSYPAVATLAAEAKLSRRAVQAALKKLQADGEIHALPEPSQYGTTVYKLPDPWGGADSAPRQSSTAAAQNETPELPQTAPDTSPNPSGDTPTDRLWAVYEEHVARPNRLRRTLDDTARRIMAAALRVRDEAECAEAIVGLSKSPHHNGRNGSGKKYLDLRYALRPNGQRGETIEERIDGMREFVTSGDTVRHAGGVHLKNTTADHSQYDQGIEDST